MGGPGPPSFTIHDRTTEQAIIGPPLVEIALVRSLALAFSLSSVFCLHLVVACSVADIPGTNVNPPDTATGPTSADLSCAQSSLQNEDVSKLNACSCKAGGKAHCVATSKMPEGLAKQLEPCDSGTGACVPDTIINKIAPIKCTSSGDEGRCLSLCVPKVAEYAASVTRGDGDVCPVDERCIPCINPATGKPTGVCEVGKTPGENCGVLTGAADAQPVACPFKGKPMNVSGYNACAPGGRCVKQSQIDSMVSDPKRRQQLKDRLAPCDTEGLCVPEEYLKEYGQHKPTECSSISGIEGRCFSTVFKDVNAQKEVLKRDVCGEIERCVPCFNPATGEPTGACNTVSCDQPRTITPPKLKDCCLKGGETRGKCVARSDVPEQFQSRLAVYECNKDGELCAPAENINPNVKPVSCSATGAKGVCVSDCVSLGFLEGVVTFRGTCGVAQTCVPCINPTTGQPTGAPGC